MVDFIWYRSSRVCRTIPIPFVGIRRGGPANGNLEARPQLLPLATHGDARGPQEKLAFVAVLNSRAALNGDGEGRPDALAVFDVDPDSESYGHVVGRMDMPNTGDELHHFGWNACSSAL